MSNRRRGLDLRSILLGAVAGAGAALAYSQLVVKDEFPGQGRVNRALDKLYRQSAEAGKLRLEPGQRYVIFSDHHKGARNLADDFQQCESTYLAAMDHYYDQGFSLILLGDVEELQEEWAPQVLESYSQVLRSEARFHPKRMIRMPGNHDGAWFYPHLVEKYMYPYFPGLEYHPGLILEYDDGKETSGEIFLAHGHQGTLESDLFVFLADWALPFYREFQILTNTGRNSPSQDACLRSMHDNRMYRWISSKHKRILIAGHTHRPVWSSRTHVDKLTAELYALLQTPESQRPADFHEQVTRLKQEIEVRKEKSPPCQDTIKTSPCYFNTGCCRFIDGDITGIEIDDGVMRLIKWGAGDNGMARTVLEQAPLSEIFVAL
jgi:UDP-2,3-diacylglucosamine pyrophosphatase LpxH